ARRLAVVPGSRRLVEASCQLLATYSGRPKLAGLSRFMASLEGVYFLRRGLFLPEELPGLMSPELAVLGLERLGGSPPGITPAEAHDGVRAVGLLESTVYLRNQLLRDGDWASMAHSVELRTPLVDAALLDRLGPRLSAFRNGAGKRMLAQAPGRPLPRGVVSRPKTGFGLPMSEWIQDRLGPRSPGMPWARQWALTVVDATP
ncbi:MAG: asparagine synthase-related protein, partial [Dehalococcoidia bacterium]|nr:asparagine synthase-related protein [Dehalococcoidia bacterium]